MPSEKQVKKIIGETPDFFYLEDYLVVPKEKFLKELNKSLLEKFSSSQPHSVVNEGNLSHVVGKLRDHRYSSSRLDNALFVSSELLYNIVTLHPFANGNKRTALSSCLSLFAINLLEHVNQVHPRGGGVEIILPSYEGLRDAQLAEAIAAWNEEKEVPGLREELAAKMKRLGFDVKQGRKPGEQQVKSFIKKFLEGIHAKAVVKKPAVPVRVITPQELMLLNRQLAFLVAEILRARRKSLEYLAKK